MNIIGEIKTTVHRRSTRQQMAERDLHRLKEIFIDAAGKVAGKVDRVKIQ